MAYFSHRNYRISRISHAHYSQSFSTMVDVAVIGCGIIGLGTAISILKRQKETKFQVFIFAKDLPPNTTSNKAAAVWYPFLASPPDKVAKWASETLEYLKGETVHPNSGVIFRKTMELLKEENGMEEPYWKDYVSSYRKVQENLPHTYKFADVIDGIVADTDLYLNYLLEVFTALGGKVIQTQVKRFDDLFAKFTVVVNCSGLGARELANDPTVFPTRGQTVVVKNIAGVDTAVSFDGTTSDELSYVIPRTSTTVLGGTAQVDNWNILPDENDTKQILQKAAVLVPQIQTAEILTVKVGLRPTRPTVRLEHEWRHNGSKLLIHNYGHGGSGYTIGWGCAFEVVDILHANISKVMKSTKISPKL